MTTRATFAMGTPSPLVGEGRGGGDGRTVGVPPTPNPSPQGGGEFARHLWHAILITALLLTPTAALAAGGSEVSPLTYQLMVFVMAIFVGYYVVWSVTPALHTPLMSVTNAISSVIVVGALLAVGVPLIAEGSLLAKVFGFLALTMASVNIFGGFLVTQRMLGMYRKKEPKK
jgi:NAD(P) transhydrogenase subunit alpha